MDQNGTALPTAAELREQSRVNREAARKIVAVAAKREMAAYAFALAQIAEAIERDNTTEKAEGYKSLLAQALQGAKELVQEVLGAMKAPPDIRRQTRARRAGAEELRTTADGFALPSAQESLRRAAANYDQMADHAESSLIAGKPSPWDEVG
jgi:hypothetical protein